MNESTAEAQKTVKTGPTREDKRNLKNDYLMGRGSLEALARKHGLSINTCRHWAHREDWVALRETVEARLAQAMVPPTQPRPEPPEEEAQGGQGKAGLIVSQIKLIDEDLAQPNLAPIDRVRLADAKSKLWNLIYAKPVQPKRVRRGLAPDVNPVEPVEPEPKP